MKFLHRNGETEPPTRVGHYWFKGSVDGEPLAEKVTVMRWAKSGNLAVIGVDATSDLRDFDGQWWGPESETPPWEEEQVSA